MRYECGHVSGLFDAVSRTAGPDGFRRASPKQICGVQAPVNQAGCLARRFDRLPSLASALLPRGDDERLGGLRHGPVGRVVRHHGPQDAGHLVGQSNSGQLTRPALQQFQQPRIGCFVFRDCAPDHRGGSQHQQLPDPLVTRATDPTQPLSASS